jgi:hypothetical protein
MVTLHLGILIICATPVECHLHHSQFPLSPFVRRMYPLLLLILCFPVEPHIMKLHEEIFAKAIEISSNVSDQYEVIKSSTSPPAGLQLVECPLLPSP